MILNLHHKILVLICLVGLIGVVQVLSYNPPPLSDDYIVIVPFPDISHITDSKQVARALNVMNVTQPGHAYIINTRDDREQIDQNEHCPHTMINIKDYSPFHNAIKHRMIERVKSLVSDTPMTERYSTAMQYFSDIYEPTIRGLDELFENHPILSKIDQSKLFFVIDTIYSSAIEWTRRRGIRYITLTNSLALPSNQYKPNIFPRMFYETTSLRRGREILERDGMLSYLMNRIDEKVFRFFDFLRNVLSIANNLNEVRKSLGYEAVRGPFVDSSDRASICFSLPGFDYSTPMPMNFHLVGFTNTILDKVKLNERDDIVDEWMNRKDIDHIVYISFGTKAVLSTNHTCDLIRNIQSTVSNYHILLSDRLKSWKDFEKCQEILPEWKNQVLLRPWVNQAKVLSHPKLKLFISHGGAHSIYESIENQVPILVIPQFADQYLNSIRIEDVDIGRTLYNPSDRLEFTKLFNELIHDSKFKTNLKRWHHINLSHTQHFSHLAHQHEISPNFIMAASVIGNIVRNGDEHLKPTEKQLYFIETIDIYHVILVMIGLPILFILIRLLIRNPIHQSTK